MSAAVEATAAQVVEARVADENIGGMQSSSATVAAVTQSALSDDEQLALALQFIKTLPDASQYSVKKIRGLLLEQQGVDLPKDVVFRAYATTIAESAPSGLDTDPSSVEDIRAFATAVAEGAPTEDDGDDSGQSDEEDDDEDEDAEVAALPEEFKSRFGQIVWVYSCKLWWPSYIFHPGKLSRRNELGKRAFRNLGKDYCAYFYGTSGSAEFGFAREKDLRPFDPADAAAMEVFRKQKMAKRYQTIFEAGIALATEELKLAPEERVAWKHPVRKPRAPRATKVKSTKKAAAKKAETDGAASTKKEPPVSKVPKAAKPAKIKAPKESSESVVEADEKTAKSPTKKKKVVVEEEDVEPPGKGSEEAAAEIREKKKEKAKPQEGAKKQKVRATDEGAEAPASKKVKVEDSSSSGKTSSSSKNSADKKSAAKKQAAPASKPVVEESSTQRASRLVLLLGMSSAVSPATAESINKTIKTMTKIKDIPLTLDELKSTGAAEAVMALRKHSDNTISVAARQIRDAWKEKFEREAKAEAAAAAVASAPVQTS